MYLKQRINEAIRAPELRLIDSQGSQVGVVSRDQALKMAKDEGLDLVEVAPNAKPPVVKIVEYKKFLFEQDKKSQAAQRKTKKAETKEFRFGPHIGSNDLLIRINRAREFLKDGAQVKISVKFRGREQSHPEVGREKINNFIAALTDVSEAKEPPKFDRGMLFTTLVPRLAKKADTYAKSENNETSRQEVQSNQAG